MAENTHQINSPKHVVFITPARPMRLADMLFPLPSELIEVIRSSGRAQVLSPTWLEAMHALGYAVWQTPSTIYVFVGE